MPAPISHRTQPMQPPQPEDEQIPFCQKSCSSKIYTIVALILTSPITIPYYLGPPLCNRVGKGINYVLQKITGFLVPPALRVIQVAIDVLGLILDKIIVPLFNNRLVKFTLNRVLEPMITLFFNRIFIPTAKFTYNQILTPLYKVISFIFKNIFQVVPKFLYTHILAPIGRSLAPFGELLLKITSFICEKIFSYIISVSVLARTQITNFYNVLLEPAFRALSQLYPRG
jgi:hypothetical protein